MPPRLRPNAYRSFGSSFSRLPGWRNDRGTQQGASRSRPPVSDSAASTAALTFEVTVLSSLTDFADGMRDCFLRVPAPTRTPRAVRRGGPIGGRNCNGFVGRTEYLSTDPVRRWRTGRGCGKGGPPDPSRAHVNPRFEGRGRGT